MQISRLLPSRAQSQGPPCWVHVSKILTGALAGTGQQTSAARPDLPWPLPHRECEKASVLVETTLYLVPCLNDCGPYGQCLLLRRHGYLYAGCSCKAGEDQAWIHVDTPVLDFPALCLSLGAYPTAKAGAPSQSQGQMPSPHSCHITPISCAITERHPQR